MQIIHESRRFSLLTSALYELQLLPRSEFEKLTNIV